MYNKEQILQSAANIISQKLNAYHVQIYDLEDEEDLDLIYYYIRNETNGKKKKMEKIIKNTRIVALVKMEKDKPFKISKRRHIYKIKYLTYDKDLNLDNVVLNEKPLLMTNFDMYE